MFSGTGVVASEFKTTHRVLANDILYFCFILSAAQLELRARPTFTTFVGEFGVEPLEYLNAISPRLDEANEEDFAFQHFSPLGAESRQYFTPENALRIDRMRQSLNEWVRTSLLSEAEFRYLLAALISEVPSVSNTTGTYGAYLKNWDKRSLSPLILRELNVRPGGSRSVAYNADANDLIKQISGDVLYLDTPYNGRQYSSNYHVLETIARYDYPELVGVTGLRRDRWGDSGYCRRSEVYDLYKTLVRNARFSTLVISYSSEGIMSAEELVQLVQEFSNREPVSFQRIPYRRYKRVRGGEKLVEEFLVVGTR
jgi:adenine-specific DNA-methyltransferase